MSLMRNLAKKPGLFSLKMKVQSFTELTAKTACQNQVSFLTYGPGYRVLFSTSVEHIPKDTECPARVSQKVMNIQPNDFLDFWHEVRH